MPDLNAVAVFTKIVEAGSFSGAAKLLNMPKATVSARFAVLEKSIGISLIVRTTRKLHVTAAGRQYFERCRVALQQLDDAWAELSAANDHPHGTLRITSPVDIGQTLLPRIVQAYLRAYPAVRVGLQVSNRTSDLIGEGIDLAIRVGPLRDSTLVTRKFMDLGANVWAAPHYLEKVGLPTAPKELSRYPFIMFRDTKTIELFKGKTSVHVQIDGPLQIDDLQSIKASVKLGNFFAWLPDFLVADDVADGLLTRVLPGWTARSAGRVSFVYPSQQHSSINIKAFIAISLEILSAEALALRMSTGKGVTS